MTYHETTNDKVPDQVDCPSVVSCIDDRFGDRFLLSMSEAARLLDIDVKTLRRHVRAGNILPVQLGFGELRPRRRFTRTEVRRFVCERQKPAVSSPLPADFAAIVSGVRTRVRTRQRERRT